MNKRLLLTTLGLTLALVPLAAVAADAPTSIPTAAASNVPTPTPAAGTVAKAAQAAHLATLKTKGAAEINRRLTSLQAAIAAINADTKLSATNHATLTTQLNAEISGLQALSTKLNAESTLAGARVDVQTVIDGFRVYALMVPKTRLVAAADDFQTIGAQFNTLANNLSGKIASTKSAGKDVTTAHAALVDMEAKLNDAKAKYTGLADKVIALTPTDYNASHTVLAADRDALVAARADFKTARADVDTIVVALGGKATAPDSSPSASAQ